MSHLNSLEESLGYIFKKNALLERALTHPSVTLNTDTPLDNYQRLEFLGDATLSLIIADRLFTLYPEEQEGMLSKARGLLTERNFLAALAKQLEIHKHIRLSESEAKAEGALKKSALENTLEAIIGAIYLDSDFNTTKKTVLSWYGDIKTLLNEKLTRYNPKGQLQEYYQNKYNENVLTYNILGTEGPDHNKSYKASVCVKGKQLAIGFGPSKKEAEEDAARSALKTLERDSSDSSY